MIQEKDLLNYSLTNSDTKYLKILLHMSHHHHHHIVPLALISLTLSHHLSLLSIASGMSSRLHPVSVCTESVIFKSSEVFEKCSHKDLNAAPQKYISSHIILICESLVFPKITPVSQPLCTRNLDPANFSVSP